MRRLNLSVGQRLSAGFLLLLAINIALVLAVRTWNAESNEAYRQFVEEGVPSYEAALELRRQLLDVAVDARSAALHGTEEFQRRFERQVATARSRLAELSQQQISAADDSLLRPIAALSESFIEQAETVARAPDAREAEVLLSQRRLELLAVLDGFVTDRRLGTSRNIEEMSLAQQRADRGVLIAAIAGALAVAIVAWLVTVSIRQPMRELVSSSESMRRGNIDPDLLHRANARAHNSRDEFTRLEATLADAAHAIAQRERQLGASRSVASASAASLSANQIAEPILQIVADHIGAEIGVVYHNGDDELQLVPLATRGLAKEVATAHASDGLLGQAIRNRKPVFVSDIPSDSGFEIRVGYDSSPPRSIAVLPLVVRDEVFGAMVLSSLREFSPDCERFLETSARQLASGLQNVRLYSTVQNLLEDLRERNETIQAQHELVRAQNEELQAQAEEIQVQNEELHAQSDEIRTQNDELFGQAEALRAQTEDLAIRDRRKSEFLGILAHELRNPMAAISNNLHILQQMGGQTSVEVRARAAMERQVHQLSRLMDDLLDVTRISHGKIVLRRETIDLVSILEDCIEDQRLAAAHSHIGLTLSTPAVPVLVYGDHSRIVQMLCNLIDNAVRASPVNGEVQVSLQLSPEDGHAVVRVRDHGHGIDPDLLPLLFQPFVQAARDVRHGQNGGLGLGLVLVRTLAQMHGGSATAFSEGPDQGAEFTVRLPLSSATSTSPHAEGVSSDEQRTSLRLLIIEDNVDAADSLREALLLEGHQVRVAYSAAEGLAAAHIDPPNVILCDLGLPEIDGYAVARAVASDPACASVILVALSGYAATAAVTQAMNAGFHHHLAKPASIAQIRTLLAEAFSDSD